jgi:hypothetical protein
MTPRPPGEVPHNSHETSAEATPRWPAPVKVPSVDELLEAGRRWHGDYTREHAEGRHAEYKAAAEHADKTAVMVERMVAEAGEHWRPTDQGRRIALEERKAAPLADAAWFAVRRWPWIAVWDTGWACSRPPWISGGFGYTGHNRAIADSLKYCMENINNIPRMTPVGSRTFLNAADKRSELPPLSLVDGEHIPRGIVKLYPMARCAECLAFVWSFRGGQNMETIRRLIAAPSLERVAEAYAIATSIAFRRERVKEHYEAEIEGAEPAPVPVPGLDALRRRHPELLGQPGPCALVRVFLSDSAKLWSARALARSDELRDALPTGRAAARSVGRWLGMLAGAGLAKPEGKGTKRRWRFGAA